jgi:hypothetical protein
MDAGVEMPCSADAARSQTAPLVAYWRLANGQIGKRPRGGSVRAVTGGLPGH